MIRFAVKTALALGLLALFVPLDRDTDQSVAGIDVLGMLSGVQEAVSDIGGFCERAPQACTAGRELAVFAGERIEAGARIAYSYVEAAIVSPEPADAPRIETASRPDPFMTGTVGDMPPPRAYMPPRTVVAVEEEKRPAATPAAVRTVAIPTPAPRT